jgi:hypothetical protein
MGSSEAREVDHMDDGREGDLRRRTEVLACMRAASTATMVGMQGMECEEEWRRVLLRDETERKEENSHVALVCCGAPVQM